MAVGDGIRTLPFPTELAVGGVGMRIGRMGADRGWRADIPLDRVHRIDFHVVLLFTEGPVRHMVDFTEYEAAAGGAAGEWQLRSPEGATVPGIGRWRELAHVVPALAPLRPFLRIRAAVRGG